MTDPTPEEPSPLAPLGSRYEQLRRAPERQSRSWRRRVKHQLSQLFVRLAGALFPALYVAYCGLVWRTSRVRDETNRLVARLMPAYGRVVGLLWHQEVFSVAYAYRPSRPHTLASVGNFGLIVTRLLERCGFVVFRGGSSGAKRRRVPVLRSMLRHMLTTPDVIYGITVDGSQGPALVCKPGSLYLAQVCRAPVIITRSWFSRRVTLQTWDRSVIPLPFGRIELLACGPYWIRPEADSEEQARFHAHIQNELLELHYRSLTVFGEEPDPAELRAYPPGWRPTWPEGCWGLKQGPWDLSDEPPPWAHRRGEQAPGDSALVAEMDREQAREEAREEAREATAS